VLKTYKAIVYFLLFLLYAGLPASSAAAIWVLLPGGAYGLNLFLGISVFLLVVGAVVNLGGWVVNMFTRYENDSTE
jgi:hypothetical protein